MSDDCAAGWETGNPASFVTASYGRSGSLSASHLLSQAHPRYRGCRACRGPHELRGYTGHCRVTDSHLECVLAPGSRCSVILLHEFSARVVSGI